VVSSRAPRALGIGTWIEDPDGIRTALAEVPLSTSAVPGPTPVTSLTSVAASSPALTSVADSSIVPIDWTTVMVSPTAGCGILAVPRLPVLSSNPCQLLTT
jgi:hypothetical protein